MTHKLFSLGLTALCIAACQSLLPEKVEIVTLGIVPDSIEVGATAGEDGVRMIADRDYQVEILSGADWLSPGLAKSDTLSFSFLSNEGFRRSARIKVSAAGREDELLVKQQGPFQERLQLSEHDVIAPASGCPVKLRVLSNLPSDYFSLRSSSESAIGKLVLNAYELSFEVMPTTARDKRKYTVTVSYIDGWGEEITDTVTVQQEAYD